MASFFSTILGLAVAVLGLSLPMTATAAEPEAGKQWVYIGTYTGQGSQGIYRCEFDPATGRLSEPQLAAESVNPSFLAVDPRHRWLYAVNEVETFHGEKTGAVTAFAIDPHTGALTMLNQQPSHGTAPCHLTVDRQGKHVLVANYSSGSVAVLPIQQNGRLGKATCVVQHKGTSLDRSRQEGPHAHCVKLDRANRFAFVCDLGLDKVMIYRYEAEQGKLTPNEPPSASVKPGSGPRHLALRPDERNAYVINEMGSTVTAFSLDDADRVMKPLQTLSTLPKGYRGNTSCAEIEVHPSGKWVYGSNRGYNSIVAYAIDKQTGKLRLIGQQRQGVNVPRNFAIDLTGRYVLVANQDGKSVIVFRIDPKTGELQPAGNKIEVAMPVCVLMFRPPQ